MTEDLTKPADNSLKGLTVRFQDKQYIAQDFAKARIVSENVSLVKFDHCNFRWTDFTDVSVMYGCVFESCDFTNALLNGVTFKNCAFLSCKFKNTAFFSATLEECNMTGSDFRDTECHLARMNGGDWSYTMLQRQSFQKQDLSHIRFCGADLSDCHFNQCNLTGCAFDEAIAYNTSFYKSDLRQATFASFPIIEASFRKAKLDLEQCVLIAEALTEGRYAPEEKGVSPSAMSK